MMFDKIINSDLVGLRRETCEENNARVEFSKQLAEDNYIILKVDAYYNSLRIHNPPPSIDCLILVKCDTNECYDFYLVELKDIKSLKGLNIKNIQQKFATTINDFLNKEFKDIFDAYCINDFKLYLVLGETFSKKYGKKMGSSQLKIFTLQKLYHFRNKIAAINPIPSDYQVKEC
jgi:hypothetical protein